MTGNLPDERELFSISAEAAVLGSIIIDGKCIPDVMVILPTAEHFYFPKNREIFDAVVSMHLGGGKIDAVLLRAELEQRGRLNKDELTVEYIGRVLDSVPSSDNAEYYARIVLEKFESRKRFAAVENMAAIVRDKSNPDDKLQLMRDVLDGLNPATTNSVTDVADVACDITVGMRNGQAGIIKTGLRAIDDQIQGIHAGQLVIIAGRTSMGKTALALTMLVAMARRGVGVLMFTLEMPVRDVIERLVCSMSGVNMVRVKANTTTAAENERLCGAGLELAHLPIFLNSSANTPGQQIAILKRLKQTKNVGVVCIDHLGFMTTGRKSENRTQEMSTISRKIKTAAVTESIPIIALSQLNRSVEGRTEKRPRLSDLRESGCIEQDADLVLMLYRPGYYGENSEPEGTTEVDICKQRNGPTGRVKLRFLSEFAAFADRTEDVF